MPPTRPDAGLVTVDRLGVDVTHEPGFCIDRPHGSGDHLLLFFLAPILLTDAGGTAVRPAGSCILHTPGYRQWYKVPTLGFSHHWLHVAGPALTGWMEVYHLPANRIFHPYRPEAVPLILDAMRGEIATQAPFWRRQVHLLTEQLFIALGRGLAPATGSGSRRNLAATEAVRQRRQEMIEHLERRWTLVDMARRSRLSRSRFSAVYHQLFGVSPIEDLLRARIDKARWILDMGPRSVAEVAAATGFSDLTWFSRLFARHVGCPPSRYNRRNR